MTQKLFKLSRNNQQTTKTNGFFFFKDNKVLHLLIPKDKENTTVKL